VLCRPVKIALLADYNKFKKFEFQQKNFFLVLKIPLFKETKNRRKNRNLKNRNKKSCSK